MTIKKLDESIIVRIAAGEVIERPANAVKELVENSIDAGATKVTVRVEQGGLRRIEVADNGSGIPPGELALAIERHATSKIHSSDDLTAIRTMGFRGEALATIAAVGLLTILSKTESGEAAVLRPKATERDEYDVQPAARDRGTTIIVDDLFARTPARLKFMKSETAEFGRISDMLERIALARPDIALELFREGKRVFGTTGGGELRQTVAAIFGGTLAKDLLEVSASHGAITVSGLVSPTHQTRKNRTGFRYHLAGRPIEDRTIAHAITAAYAGVIPPGNFPIVFLRLDVPYREVDVNVHPAKAEVRFRDSAAIHHAVSSAIRSRIQGHASLPSISTAPRSVVESTYDPREGVIQALFDFEKEKRPAAAPTAPSDNFSSLISKSVPIPSTAQPPATERNLRLTYQGAVAGRYLIAEDLDGLVIVDQHAAHERVLFDELMRQAQNGEVTGSPLLVPMTVDATPSERSLAEEHLSFFREIGFEIEVWPDSLAIHAVPSVLSHSDATRVIRDVIGHLKESGVAKAEKVPYERLAKEACKSAVKGTQRLESVEADRLLRDLVATTDPYNCPHGRPTMIRLTLGELDRRFGRT